MKQLTDIEIEEQIAIIENIHYVKTKYKGNANFIALISENDFTGTPPEMIGKYSPLTDDALCFKLMIKYKVMVDFDNGKFLAETLKGLFIPMAKWEPEKDDIRYDSANKAICLAIIEAHKE